MKVIRICFIAYKNHFLARRSEYFGFVGVKGNLPGSRSRTGGKSNNENAYGHIGVNHRVQKLVELLRSHAPNGKSFVNNTFGDHFNGNTHRSRTGALAVTGLQHEEFAVLHGELDVLDVVVVALELLADLAELGVQGGPLVAQRRDALGQLFGRSHGRRRSPQPFAQLAMDGAVGFASAVVVQGDAVGTTLYYGKGAGAEPTASAVIADLVDVTRLHTADPEHRVPHLAFQPDQITDVPVLPIEEVETSYYLRLRVLDKPGVLADVTRILADQSISIDAMLQREPEEGESQTDIIILTHLTIEKNMNAAIAKVESLDSVTGKVTRLRLENL